MGRQRGAARPPDAQDRSMETNLLQLSAALVWRCWKADNLRMPRAGPCTIPSQHQWNIGDDSHSPDAARARPRAGSARGGRRPPCAGRQTRRALRPANFLPGLARPVYAKYLLELERLAPGFEKQPGIFLVKPDGTLYYGATQTMPFARLPFADLLGATDHAIFPELSGHEQDLMTPTDSCLFFHQCAGCNALMTPKPGDCCVFCSDGAARYPPKKIEGGACCALSSGDDARARAAGVQSLNQGEIP